MSLNFGNQSAFGTPNQAAKREYRGHIDVIIIEVMFWGDLWTLFLLPLVYLLLIGIFSLLNCELFRLGPLLLRRLGVCGCVWSIFWNSRLKKQIVTED